MLSTVCLLVVLLGVVSVSAQSELPLGNPNGLKVVLSPTSFSVSRQLLTSPPQTTGEITLSLASIRELGNNMNQLSNPSTIVYGSFQDTRPWVDFGEIQTVCQTIAYYTSSSTQTVAGLITLCGIQNNGIIYLDTEIISVTKGQLIILTRSMVPWTALGTYLEVKVSMSVTRGRTMSLTTGFAPVKLGLGTTDSYALLSTKVFGGNLTTFNTMPTGYPKLSQNNPVDNNANIIAMFARGRVGTDFLVWGMMIDPGYSPASSSPGYQWGPQAPGSGPASVVASWMIHAIAAALACLAGSFDRRH